MSKEVLPYTFNLQSDDLCEFLPTEYCHSMKCDTCPFYHASGVAAIMLYVCKDKEDETNE